MAKRAINPQASRRDLVRRWTHRSRQSADPFDQFFAAWIALVIAARGRLTAQQLAQPDTDRVAIMSLFQAHANAVSAVLGSAPNDVAWARPPAVVEINISPTHPSDFAGALCVVVMLAWLRQQVNRWPKRCSRQRDHFEILSAAATKALAH
jgi:hypothetical protein